MNIIKANRKIKHLRSNNICYNKSAYTAMVGGLVALLLTIIIGVMVFYEVGDSIELSSDSGNTSKNETYNMAETVFSLLKE